MREPQDFCVTVQQDNADHRGEVGKKKSAYMLRAAQHAWLLRGLQAVGQALPQVYPAACPTLWQQCTTLMHTHEIGRYLVTVIELMLMHTEGNAAVTV